MNIRQLRYISSVAKNGLNVSATADSLFTSQPGVSKQIKLLEEELGVLIFERRGRQLVRMTPAGEAIVEQADRVLVEIDSLQKAAREYSAPGVGELSIALTHTVARYAFPPVMKTFAEHYPQVRVHLHLATPSQIADKVNRGEADFGIATEVMTHFEDLVALPCYRWRRAVLAPLGHALGDGPLTLAGLAQYPLITYTFGFDIGSPLQTAFSRLNLTPEPVLTATDADVIKTYVRQGFGIGITAALAYDAEADADLCCLNTEHLFETSTAYIVFRRGSFFRDYVFDFLRRFAPHLNEDVVRQGLALKTGVAPDVRFDDDALPLL